MREIHISPGESARLQCVVVAVRAVLIYQGFLGFDRGQGVQALPDQHAARAPSVGQQQHHGQGHTTQSESAFHVISSSDPE